MRALYEWIVENDCTPYLLVDAAISDVLVPQQYVKDGQIVLNVSPGAVMDLNISNDAVTFNGRFGGVAFDIYVPVGAVMGIYARENGQGMVFDAEEAVDEALAEGNEGGGDGRGGGFSGGAGDARGR